MIAFLRFLFILLIVWFATRLIFRYVVPWFIMRFVKKQQDKYSEYFQSQETKKEGDVEIKVNKNDTKDKNDDSFGEYIDFEEVEPEKDKDE